MSDLTSTIISWAISVVNLLPDSPFSSVINGGSSAVSDILGYVNWFVPFNIFADIFVSWLACVAVYYVYQIALRWVKVVE